MVRVAKPSLLLAHLTARQTTSLIIVFDNVDNPSLVWIAFHYGERSVGAKGLNSLRSTIEVIIMGLVSQNAVRIFLHEIYLAIEVPIALNTDKFVVLIRLHYVRVSVTGGIDRYLVFIGADTLDPLVRPAVAAAMSDDSVRAPVAGEKCES